MTAIGRIVGPRVLVCFLHEGLFDQTFVLIYGKVLQKSTKLINFFFHLDLDVMDYGEFKYDLRKFMGSPP